MLKKFSCMNVLPPAAAGDLVTVVSGLPRSGTSMLMRVLERGGIAPLTDNIRQQDSRNPHGYFELESVKDKHSYGNWIGSARGKAIKVVSRFLPYLPASQQYRILFLHRDIDAVLRSQQDMAQHYSGNGWDDGAAARLKQAYRQHVADTLAWVEQRPNMLLHQLQYEELTATPDGPLQALGEFMRPHSLRLSDMRTAIDPSLNHANVKGDIHRG